ncbi:MAG: hypothetical protein ABJP33_06055 [Pseudoruegeria sp.]
MREFANPLISRLRRKSALTGRIAALIWVGQWPVWAVCDLGPWAIRQMLRRIRGRQRAQPGHCKFSLHALAARFFYTNVIFQVWTRLRKRASMEDAA